MISRVVVINDASIARGGATGLALLSIGLMRARGIAVTYLVGDEGKNEELERLGVEVVAVGGKPLVKQNPVMALGRGLYNRSAGAKVAAWIAENDNPTTVYHVHGWSKILTPAIFPPLRKVALRTFLHAHDFFLACPNGAFMNYPKGTPCELVPLSTSCLATQCDKRNYAQKLWRVGRLRVLDSVLTDKDPWAGVMMIHPRMRHYLEKGVRRSRHMFTVRNPAEPFSRQRIRCEDNETVFFIGRVEAEKGVAELLSAAKRAKVPVAVIGDGPLRDQLTKEYPNVQFHGWRTRAEIATLLSAARGVIMPSRYPEPFGLVAAEASQSGLPVLLSRSSFLSEEIVTHRIGFEFDNDESAIAGALRMLADLPRERLQAMSERAHSNVARLSLTSDQWIDALLASYDAAIMGRPALLESA
ncbi:glycosyltransferase family 4 protein [Aureimonas phyllosphaerae]|uniref:glycosyltransferase family 4 protein n=1 Tax=Aureimonas phyllosphaerae TaxID=1166078 RepID=UPI003A5C4BE7